MKHPVPSTNPGHGMAASPPPGPATDSLKQIAERIAERGALFLCGRFFLGCCLAVITLCVTYQAFERPFHAWNDVRLTRTFALLGNQEIYPSADEGPILAGIYGPVGFAA
jgi:hypothetical protein